MTTRLDDLEEQWLEAKADEHEAQQRRREIEDEISELLGDIDSIAHLGYITVTPRTVQHVDYDMMIACAREHGLIDEVPTLFRFKADINQKAWKKSATDTQRAFNKAITTKKNRPQFAAKKGK